MKKSKKPAKKKAKQKINRAKGKKSAVKVKVAKASPKREHQKAGAWKLRDTSGFGVSEEEIKSDPKKIPVLNAHIAENPVRNFKPKINLQVCTNSYNCIVYCPHDAIDKNDKGKPQIDYNLCTGCLICLRECPTNAISEEREMK